MSGARLDHLVVVAASLEEGDAWCESTFGVTPAAGGSHALMGTHNRLLNISSTTFERAYLEIIAIDPAAPPPSHARWFGMDAPAPRPPRLVHWVARSGLLDMHRWALVNLGFDPGATRAAQRGTLSWRLTVRDDGGLPCRGALPTLIEWQGAHPTDTLPGSGIVLRSLTLRGLPDAAQRALQLRGVALHSQPRGAALEACLDTPRGPVTLLSGPHDDD